MTGEFRQPCHSPRALEVTDLENSLVLLLSERQLDDYLTQMCGKPNIFLCCTAIFFFLLSSDSKPVIYSLLTLSQTH